MRLVVHVSENSRENHKFAFEVRPGQGIESAEDVQDRLESGEPVHGWRLWLDYPVTVEELGLPDDPDLPRRVRIVQDREAKTIWSGNTRSVDSWRSGRVAELVD